VSLKFLFSVALFGKDVRLAICSYLDEAELLEKEELENVVVFGGDRATIGTKRADFLKLIGL
jgi:hypothetical protein